MRFRQLEPEKELTGMAYLKWVLDCQDRMKAFAWKIRVGMEVQTKMAQLEQLLKQAALDGVITCPKCHNNLESDAEKCSCGWKNPLPEGGWI